MSENNDNNNTSSTEETHSNLVDMMLGQKGETVYDSETMILETQKRVWGALKKGYEYSGIVDDSDKFLREHVFSKIEMVVLYVDLVGSTTMTLELPEEKLAIDYQFIFSRDGMHVIRQHKGYVFKICR